MKSRVAETVATIRQLPTVCLTDRVTVQNYNVSVLEAIAHVVEHFAEHTGQIILLTKLYTSADLGYYKHLNTGRSAGVP